SIPDDVVDQLPQDVRILTHFYYHSRHEVRLLLYIGDQLHQVDVSHVRYSCLPDATILPDGDVFFHDPRGADARRPYPNGREWREVVTKSPVRDQDRFRRDVLRAYGQQCAMCDVSNPALLRA